MAHRPPDRGSRTVGQAALPGLEELAIARGLELAAAAAAVPVHAPTDLTEHGGPHWARAAARRAADDLAPNTEAPGPTPRQRAGRAPGAGT